MALINILVGAALLLVGRKLFWLFVAGVGFLAGMDLATRLLPPNQPVWLLLAVGAVFGIVGAILSIFLQRIVVGIAGFLAGGYIASMIAINLKYSNDAWIAFIAGGIIGAFLVMVLLNWALIFLSSLMGAAAIAQNVSLKPEFATILFFVLAIFGMIVQFRQLERKHSES